MGSSGAGERFQGLEFKLCTGHEAGEPLLSRGQRSFRRAGSCLDGRDDPGSRSGTPVGATVSDTVLGDWFATVVFWRPQVAVFVSESTLLPVFVPFAPTATLLGRFPSALAAVLRAHGVAEPLIDREVTGAVDHTVATTNDRSVVGVVYEFARLAEWRRDEVDNPDGLTWLSNELAQTPCSPVYKRHVSPDRELHAVFAG